MAQDIENFHKLVCLILVEKGGSHHVHLGYYQGTWILLVYDIHQVVKGCTRVKGDVAAIKHFVGGTCYHAL